MSSQETLRDKIILVTGGSGSIGSQLVRECLVAGAHTIRILSRDENRQYRLQQELNSERLRFLIGDIRDATRLKRAMKDVDIVFHAAALKQVPYCEYNPFEAVQTNVVGSQNLVESALDAGVKRVVSISTDKAVNPVNTMGATKLLSEKIVTRANLWTSDTIFSCVRFGNVLGSRGSVVGLIEKQILQKRGVHLTDKSMTRFMMTIAQAAQLVLKAATLARPGEIFVLPMKALSVETLIEVLRDHFCQKHQIPLCSIQEIGKRPGEKLHEELVTSKEHGRVRKVDGFFVIENISGFRQDPVVELQPSEYLSHQAPLMSRQGVKQLLKEGGIG